MSIPSEHWNSKVSNWEVANKFQIGTVGFFMELKHYRFEKSDCQEDAVPLDIPKAKAVLNISFGHGSYTSLFARGGISDAVRTLHDAQCVGFKRWSP